MDSDCYFQQYLLYFSNQSSPQNSTQQHDHVIVNGDNSNGVSGGSISKATRQKLDDDDGDVVLEEKAYEESEVKVYQSNGISCDTIPKEDNNAYGQHQSESQMQPLSANGISHEGIVAQNVQYAAPPQLGTGHAMVHLQLMGIQQACVPLPTYAVEEPVFVNAKQYHCILRRRQSRAKAESENKVKRNRKKSKRMWRWFLSSKKNENQQNEAASTDNSQSNINLNSDKNDLAPSDKTP